MNGQRVMLCVDSDNLDAVLDRAVALLHTDLVWVPVHVVDAGGPRDLGLLRRGHPGAGPLSAHQHDAIDEATHERARRLLEGARMALDRHGLQHAPAQVSTGEPGHEICSLAASMGAELIVLRASRHPHPPSGPKSVGHTARFVLDHAPCPVLLLR